MPVYEYRCRTCDARFEMRRAMADADASAPCPDGHDDAVRLLSVFASVGGAPESAPPAAGGGGCGGSCACYPG